MLDCGVRARLWPLIQSSTRLPSMSYPRASSRSLVALRSVTVAGSSLLRAWDQGREGDNTIIAFDASGRPLLDWRSTIPILVARSGYRTGREHPGLERVYLRSARCCDHHSGVPCDGGPSRPCLFPGGLAAFRKPRGLRFGPDGNLYCVAREEVVRFDFETGQCLGPIVELPCLNGRALIFFPWILAEGPEFF